MAKNKTFSIVIPTYTGEQHIGVVFDSIISQDVAGNEYEVVVVVDGKKPSLRKIVDLYAKKFRKQGVDFSIVQFAENKGRFTARYEGAKKAKCDYLLFLDDRSLMAEDYLQHMAGLSDHETIIPNVVQASSPTLISKFLYIVRKKLYKTWGEDFESYEITAENFESSSKGTGSLWIQKSIYLQACDEFKEVTADLRHSSDDTKLLKIIIANGHSIYRYSDAKIYYQSRTDFTGEIQHLFARGSTFVDYYSKPGTRYFYPLMVFYIGVTALVVLTFVYPTALIYLLLMAVVAVILLAGILAKSLKDFFVVVLALPLVSMVFGAGLILGLARKLLSKKDLGNAKE
jgi:glycosyltransferase involved in cell wall biosynthesis